MVNKKIVLGGAAAMALAVGFLGAQGPKEEVKTDTAPVKVDPKIIKQTIVNIEYQGTKVWVPTYLIVPYGAKVELKLINDTPSGVHGFTIPDFGVKVEVAKGQPKELSFIAGKEGLFPIMCQLHPAHIGGQILVLPETKSRD